MNEELLTSEQCVQLYGEVGLSENTFYRNAREGKIKKFLSKDRRRGATYSGADVRRIVDQYKQRRKIRVNALASKKYMAGGTDWVKESDLPYVLALDYEMYGIEEAVDISITHFWVKKNPFISWVLYNVENRKDVWGAITLMPLDEEIIFKLLRREMHERDIRPEHIHTYDDGGKFTLYAASIVLRPEHRAALRDLMNSVLQYWCSQYPRISIKKVYAYADSDEGWRLIKHLFFAPRYDIGEKAFELDPYQLNPSRVIQAFQDCLKEKKLADEQVLLE